MSIFNLKTQNTVFILFFYLSSFCNTQVNKLIVISLKCCQFWIQYKRTILTESINCFNFVLFSGFYSFTIDWNHSFLFLSTVFFFIDILFIHSRQTIWTEVKSKYLWFFLAQQTLTKNIVLFMIAIFVYMPSMLLLLLFATVTKATAFWRCNK